VTHEDFVVHVVDSDQAIADGLATLLATYGVEVLRYPDIDSFLRYWLPRRHRNCCLITESDTAECSGPALLRELEELNVEIPLLLLVNASSAELIKDARSSDQFGVIRKPCLDHTLVQRVLSLRSSSVAEPPAG
jgi:FixJ family two-component response regulator